MNQCGKSHAEAIFKQANELADQTLDNMYELLSEDIDFSQIKFTKEMVQKILYNVFIIKLIERDHNITAATYPSKLQSYFKMVNKIKETYGYNLPSDFPFPNPTELKHKIDSLLIQMTDNTDQRSIFWKTLLGDKNAPNRKYTDLILLQQPQNS